MDFGIVASISRYITDLPGGITCIDAGFVRPQHSACYLLKQGNEAVIIDSGTGHSVNTIKNVLRYRDVPPDSVRYIVLTHVHPETAGGAGELLQLCRNARLVVHPQAMASLQDPALIVAAAAPLYDEDTLARKIGTPVPVTASRMQVAEDHTVLEVNGRKLEITATPGHSPEHIVIHDGQTHGIFAGNAFGMAFDVLITEQGPYLLPNTASTQLDLQRWYLTLDSFDDMQPAPERMFLSHYGMLEDIKRHAVALRRRLETFESIARKHIERDNRIEHIKSEITESTLTELAALKCSLPAPACRGLLQRELGMNARGLDHWLKTIGPAVN